VHNLQIQLTEILQTRFYEQEQPSSVGAATALLQVKEGYQSNKPPFCVLNKIHRQIIFPLICSMQENKTKYYQRAMYEDNFSTFPQPRIRFWITSSGFLKRPVLLKYWLLRPFFYKEATCKNSTVKGLLYTAKAVPSKDYFMHLTLINARKGR
jgi:hypothetical protein